MNVRSEQITIYHITDLENLASILAAGGLWSDVRMAQQQPATVIGYGHIKKPEDGGNHSAVLRKPLRG